MGARFQVPLFTNRLHAEESLWYERLSIGLFEQSFTEDLGSYRRDSAVGLVFMLQTGADRHRDQGHHVTRAVQEAEFRRLK